MRAAFHTAVAALAIASFSMLGISGCAKPFEVRTLSDAVKKFIPMAKGF